MIVRIAGDLKERSSQTLVIDVHGLHYQVLVPFSVMQRVDENVTERNRIELIIYHYIQLSPSQGFPVLVGFFNTVERDFFQQFIKVSGIGPRAAVKALNRPISEIARAINEGDQETLTGLPGIGAQKAKEIVAKLQGKVGRYGLIQDKCKAGTIPAAVEQAVEKWEQEALCVLEQLQYKKPEAIAMIRQARLRAGHIRNAEELINEIYKQRIAA